MNRRSIWATVGVSAIVSAASVAATLVFWSATLPSKYSPQLAAVDPEHLDSDWSMSVVGDMPEDVCSLAGAVHNELTYLYAGTGPVGGVYQFRPAPPYLTSPLAIGVGDLISAGVSRVSSLATHDLDGDGVPELVAGTNQEHPIGAPKLLVWSLTFPHRFRGVASPGIESSWTHGIGFATDRTTKSPTILSTYCGHGEVVEYSLDKRRSESGFVQEGIAWKQIGKINASGEQIVTADVDSDGSEEIVLASGFRINEAEILIYGRTTTPVPSESPFVQGSGTLGREWAEKAAIDEGKRFGNVRVLVGDATGNGNSDLVAWWCTDLAGGYSEMIRYQVGPHGILGRELLANGSADVLWPLEGQMTLSDMNGDGQPEVWFAVRSGYLWQFDPVRGSQSDSAGLSRLSLICRMSRGFGPIVASPKGTTEPPCLYVASKNAVMRINPSSEMIAPKRSRLEPIRIAAAATNQSLASLADDYASRGEK